MKLLKITFLLSFLVSPLSYSQWWVSGGNLIWPHGDIKINNDLNVDGAINGAKYYVLLFSHDGGSGSPSVTDLFNNIGSNSSWIRVSAGLFRTTFSDISFDNTKAFNTRPVALDDGDTQIHYTTYTSGSNLFIQIHNFATLSMYDPSVTRLPVSLVYYP